MHTPNTADIARSVEHGPRRIIKVNALRELRTLFKRDSRPRDWGIRIKLIEQEAAYKLGKAWLFHMQCKQPNIARYSTNCSEFVSIIIIT
jgi:hypothetical protein